MDKNLEHALATLETILRQQLQLHEQLLAMMDRKREALRGGDAQRLAEACRLENEKVQAVGELEKRRLETVAGVTLMVAPAAAEPMPMAELIDHLPAPTRDKLTLLRSELRKRMTAVKEQASIAHRATESLVRHVQGLVQTIGAITTGVSTYANNGVRPRQATAVSTFSMTA